MKKNNYLMSALLLGGMLLSTLTAGAEDRVVKLTTSQAVGTEMTFLVNRTYAGVTVDWGDGFPVTYNTGTDAIREVKGTVKGTSITITGNAAWDMFSCASCSVETIDLSGATGLRSLFCQDNNLSIISMKGMSNLVDLDASNNQLTSIEYTKSSNPELDLSKIENINLSNNKLSGTFVIRTKTLRTIDISNNEYTTMYVSTNSALDALNCSNNQLKALSLVQNSALSTLVCSDNNISTLTLPSSLTAFQQIVCDNNNISTTLNLANCTELSDLSCSGNKLKTIYLPTNTKTSSLNLANNQLGFGVLPKRSQRPAFLAFMPQATIDVSGYTNMQKKDGIPYMPTVAWTERRDNQLDLSALRNIAVTSTSTGTTEGNIAWYAEDNDGNQTELKAGTTSSAMNDYFAQAGKFTFFTAQPRVFARITANTVYKDDNLYVETSRFAVGEEGVTGIGNITSEKGDLQLLTTKGSITLSCDGTLPVRIVTIGGKTVWNGNVSGTVTLSFPSGAYIVNGQKVLL